MARRVRTAASLQHGFDVLHEDPGVERQRVGHAWSLGLLQSITPLELQDQHGGPHQPQAFGRLCATTSCPAGVGAALLHHRVAEPSAFTSAAGPRPTARAPDIFEVLRVEQEVCSRCGADGTRRNVGRPEPPGRAWDPRREVLRRGGIAACLQGLAPCALPAALCESALSQRAAGSPGGASGSEAERREGAASRTFRGASRRSHRGGHGYARRWNVGEGGDPAARVWASSAYSV